MPSRQRDPRTVRHPRRSAGTHDRRARHRPRHLVLDGDERVPVPRRSRRGRPVCVVLDVAERDTFGRLRAYLYVEDPAGGWVAKGSRRFPKAKHALAAVGPAATMRPPCRGGGLGPFLTVPSKPGAGYWSGQRVRRHAGRSPSPW